MFKSKKLLFILSNTLFAIYCLITIWAIMFKCNYSQAYIDSYEYLYGYNIIERLMISFLSLKEHVLTMLSSPLSIPVLEEVANIIIFIPLGLYTSFMFKKKKLLYTFLLALGSTLMFETIQLLTLIGSFSIFDICNNIIGALCGYGLYRLLNKLTETDKKRTKVNIALLIGNIMFLPLLIYAFFSTVNNFDIYVDIILRRL